MVTKRLSAMPLAILPRVLAVAGAITIASAHTPRSTWLFHEPLRSSKNSESTAGPVSVESVRGAINSLAAGVITTCTSAPAFTRSLAKTALLYAAILPVMPSTIFFPFTFFRLLSLVFADASWYLLGILHSSSTRSIQDLFEVPPPLVVPYTFQS